MEAGPNRRLMISEVGVTVASPVKPKSRVNRPRHRVFWGSRNMNSTTVTTRSPYKVPNTRGWGKRRQKKPDRMDPRRVVSPKPVYSMAAVLPGTPRDSIWGTRWVWIMTIWNPQVLNPIRRAL